MKLRLVVIDDEVLVRKGIISSVDWERHGIEIAGEATDGRSALELIRSERPHIVLTDIRMPHMDGLELIRRIRDELPDTKIFILSVLDDFGTVREALRLGVVDYIPKLSMTPDELLQVVLRVKGLAAPGPAAAAEPGAALKAPAPLPAGRPERVCAAWVEAGTAYRLAKIAAAAGLEGALRELAAAQPPFRAWRAEDGCAGWVLAPAGTEPLGEALARCRAGLAPGAALTAGVSGPALGPAGLAAAAREAEAALGRSFYGGLDAVYVWDEERRAEPASRVLLAKEAANAYFAALEEGSEGAADRLLRQLFPASVSEEVPQLVVRDEAYQWVSAVSSHVKERGGSLHSALSGVSPFEELGRLTTYPDIREWCFRLHDVVKSMLSSLRSSHRREITKAIDYVQAHYMLPIRVKDIAQSVHLSENYFSNVFAKETGKPFIQFLQEIRVEQARRLLKEEDADWTVIGEKVGFDNPKYFTKVFKKFTGVTPKQYARAKK